MRTFAEARDFVGQACQLAVEMFGKATETGGTDGMFNGAGFSVAFQEVGHFRQGLDGTVVAAILSGRDDVVRQPDGSHYVYLPAAYAAKNEHAINRLVANQSPDTMAKDCSPMEQASIARGSMMGAVMGNRPGPYSGT